MNRLVQKRPDPRRFEPAISFGYNELGLRTNMVDASGVTTCRYDNRNRLIEKATPEGTLTYSYNANGQVTNIASLNANGVRLNYAYDELNRLSAVFDPHAGWTSYSYDDVGNLHSFMYPNGVATVYDYSSLNRLTNMNVVHGLSTIASYAYTLAPSGHRTSAVESRVLNSLNPQVTTLTRLYGYDQTYRLTNETIGGTSYASPATLDYSYDKVGNRRQLVSTQPGIVSQMLDYDPNDRLLSDSYDSNGNTLTSPSFGMSQSDQYDFENRLTRRTDNNKTVTIVYDGDGNRVKKTVTTATNTVTIRFLVDTVNPTGYAQVLEGLTSSNALPAVVTRVYAYGHALLSQDRFVTSGWTASYYGYDGHGNVRLLTDQNGFVTDTYDYDAFGNLIARTGLTANDYLFTGEQFDPDLGLYFLRARYQNTQTGRFWTMDEFEGTNEDPQSLHKYLYVAGDPINSLDPSGRFQISVRTLLITVAIVAIVATTAYVLLSRPDTIATRQGKAAIQAEMLGAMRTIKSLNLILQNEGYDNDEIDKQGFRFVVVGRFGVALAPIEAGDDQSLATKRQNLRNAFEMWNNDNGWWSAFLEGVARAGGAANHGPADPDAGPHQRVRISEALKKRAEAYLEFLKEADKNAK